MSVHEYVGNPHVHTCYSDGTALHAEVARAAAEAGLDFVIVTDHNVWVDGVEGYYDEVLLLVGEELHDVRCRPQASHLLAFGVDEELAPLASDPQSLIDEVNRRGGIAYLAHPFELASPVDLELDAIPWGDWSVRRYAGIELWNYMSEFKGLLQNRLAALFYAYAPSLGIRGPYQTTLRKWDELLADGQRLSVIGASDAHGKTYSLGPLSRQVFPYRYLFRCVNTHVLTDLPFSGEPDHDRRLIVDGLRAGRTWVGYDLPASTSGFDFRARSGVNEALVGQELVRTGAVGFSVRTPQPADTRLLRDGRVVARSRGRSLEYTTAEPGTYRVEVYLRYRLRRRGWIFSSPIYVK
ncbi:MAG: CehA/McbA family metallohydrolase [Chloroflexota bacterium]|nr:CehA/McbA family metallohydrolase [Chloroflexota bacterium]